jgi:hypothetical protein
MRPLAVFAAFVLVGLSPSFLDWRSGDERTRKEILVYYGVAGALILIANER